MLAKQVERTINILEDKHPDAQGLLIFDHVPTHMNKPQNSLNADRINFRWPKTTLNERDYVEWMSTVDSH